MSQHVSVSDGDFSSLFNFLPIGAFRSTPDGMMVRANPALVQINGFTSEADAIRHINLVGSDWYVLPQRRTEFLECLRRDGFVRGFESQIKRHIDGRIMWVNENAHEVRDAQGKLMYFEGTVEDVTERVHAEQALKASEEQMGLIAREIPGMVYVVHLDPSGKKTYRYVSPGVEEIYGLTPEAVMAEPELVARYRHPDDAAWLEADLKLIADQAPNLGGEFRIVWPSGEVKWILRRSSAVEQNHTGQVRVGVLLDVTQRKQAEVALLENEALWKLALESAGDGVWDWNLITGEEYLSESIKAMFGYSSADILNFSIEMDDRTHPDDVVQMNADRQAHFDGRTLVYRNEHRVRCKDGSWKWVLSRGMVIARDDDGTPLRMVGTHTDITEHKHSEAQKKLLEIQLREAQKLEAIGTLAGGVAHDFNNLLAVILGNLSLAREDVGPDHPAQESLTEINRASVRARHLVQQILAFSRRQVQELKHQPLLPLVEETLALMRSLLPAGVSLVVDSSDEPQQVLADATQLQQVLMNLCTNAWQALDGRAGKVSVGLCSVAVNEDLALRLGGISVGNYARLSVSDDGPGMDTATLERIFEPFYTTKAPGAGTGLGLAVVHGIVKAHGGTIDVQSRQGSGTRFDVYLRSTLEDALADGGGDSGFGSVAASGQDAKGRHVVYIDDYEAMVFLVGRLLRKQGYRVTTFTSGEDALAWFRAQTEPVDIVVTDQNMPGVSGVEVAAELKVLRPGLRTVLISGHVNDELMAQAAAVGVLEVMGKQNSMAELGESIRDLMDTLVP